MACRHGCGEEMRRRELGAHDDECPSTPVPCPNACGAALPRRDVEDHGRECPLRPRPCPAQGCEFRAAKPHLARHLMEAHEALLMEQLAPLLEGRVEGSGRKRMRVEAPAAGTTREVKSVCARQSGGAICGG
jgi:hypothetical protein